MRSPVSSFVPPPNFDGSVAVIRHATIVAETPPHDFRHTATPAASAP
jgi:hypothetical protein